MIVVHETWRFDDTADTRCTAGCRLRDALVWCERSTNHDGSHAGVGFNPEEPELFHFVVWAAR